MQIIEAAVQRCRELMDEKELNPNQLANLAGVTPSTVYSFLGKKRKRVSINVILTLCLGFDITPAEFFASPLFDDIESNL